MSNAWVAVRQQAGIPADARELQTQTRVDTGGWGLNPRLRVTALNKELVLYAAGKRPFIERQPFQLLGESHYNHVTGELMLAPGGDARVRRLRLPPIEGQELLDQIQGKEN